MTLLTFPCPFCGSPNQVATPVDVDPNPPKAGDVSICIKCAEFCIFTGNALEARKPTLEERDAIMDDPDLRRIVHRVKLNLLGMLRSMQPMRNSEGCLRAAAEAAAQESALNERARCLWCADEVVRELREKISKKFLLSAAHEHAAKAKLQIAEAVVRELRRAIISGVRPPPSHPEGPSGHGTGGVADLSTSKE